MKSILDLIFNSLGSIIDQQNAIFSLTFNDNRVLQHTPEMAQMSLIFNNNGEQDIPNSQFLPTYYMEHEKAQSFPYIIYIPSEAPNIRFQQHIPMTQFSSVFAYKAFGETLLSLAETYIKEHILSKALESVKATRQEKIKDAVIEFNKIFDNAEMVTELSDLSSAGDGNRPVFKTITGEKVFLANLSSGEMLLYAKVAALMQFEPKNKLILIDEPEMSFHPRWQRKIINIYEKIPGNNQFIIATHSPHVLSSVNYKDIILLNKNATKKKIESSRLQNAPLSADINNTLRELMGADFIRSELSELHRKYRKFVEDGTENMENGISLRNHILEYESNESEFMQEMKFLSDLKNFK